MVVFPAPRSDLSQRIVTSSRSRSRSDPWQPFVLHLTSHPAQGRHYRGLVLLWSKRFQDGIVEDYAFMP